MCDTLSTLNSITFGHCIVSILVIVTPNPVKDTSKAEGSYTYLIISVIHVAGPRKGEKATYLLDVSHEISGVNLSDMKSSDILTFLIENKSKLDSKFPRDDCLQVIIDCIFKNEELLFNGTLVKLTNEEDTLRRILLNLWR